MNGKKIFVHKTKSLHAGFRCRVCGLAPGSSRRKKFILSTAVNKSKIKEQMRFCYICPIGKVINRKAAKDK